MCAGVVTRWYWDRVGGRAWGGGPFPVVGQARRPTSRATCSFHCAETRPPGPMSAVRPATRQAQARARRALPQFQRTAGSGRGRARPGDPPSGGWTAGPRAEAAAGPGRCGRDASRAAPYRRSKSRPAAERGDLKAVGDFVRPRLEDLVRGLLRAGPLREPPTAASARGRCAPAPGPSPRGLYVSSAGVGLVGSSGNGSPEISGPDPHLWRQQGRTVGCVVAWRLPPLVGKE